MVEINVSQRLSFGAIFIKKGDDANVVDQEESYAKLHIKLLGQEVRGYITRPK